MFAMKTFTLLEYYVHVANTVKGQGYQVWRAYL